MSRPSTFRRHWAWWLAMVVVVAGVFVFAGSRPPEDGTSDDRLYGIAEQLKCLQCVGESVAASQSPLAVQFRDEIRVRMDAGDSDDEILAFFSDSYGNEVLLDPPSSGIGVLAWLLPVLVAGAAVVGLGFAFTRWRDAAVASGGEPDPDAGPRIDEVQTVGSVPGGARRDASSGHGDDAVGGGLGGDDGDSGDDGDGGDGGGRARARGLAALGAVAAFGVAVVFLVVANSGERGDGELTGGIRGSESSPDSGVAECQPVAMSDPQAGIECYDDVLEEDPEDATALTYRGWAHLRAGDADTGVADLERAVELAPELADPHVFLAIAAVDSGDFERAGAEMERFWAADPSEVAVSVVRSEGLERQIFFALMSAPTRDCWQLAAQEAPSGEIDQPFLDSLGGCLDLVLAADPSDPDARLSRALAHLGPESSDVESARAILGSLLDEDPADSDALALLVSLDISEGDLDAGASGLEVLRGLPRGDAAFLIGDAAALDAALEAAREAGGDPGDG